MDSDHSLNMNPYFFHKVNKIISIVSLIGCFLLIGMVSKYPTYFLSLDIEPHASYFTD